MRKHLTLAVTSVVFASGLVLWSQPTVPAAHTDLRPLSSPAAIGALATDAVTINEIAAAEEARMTAARTLARQKRANAFSIDGGY